MEPVVGAVSVVEDAFARSDLPKVDKRPDLINPLGMEDFDWFVLNVLSNAGITVECIGAGVEGVSKYQAVQIVDESDMERAFKEMNPVNISYCDWYDMRYIAGCSGSKFAPASP